MAQELIRIQEYRYRGFFELGGPEGRVFVDLDHKHPDPCDKLTWGYDKDGDAVPGDYNRLFEKVGKVYKFSYDGNVTRDEKGHYLPPASLRHAKIVKAIKLIVAGE